MDPGRAAREQLGALLGAVGDAELELGPLVAAERLQRGRQRRRDAGVAELADAPHLLEADDRDDRRG